MMKVVYGTFCRFYLIFFYNFSERLEKTIEKRENLSPRLLSIIYIRYLIYRVTNRNFWTKFTTQKGLLKKKNQ